MSLRPKTAKPGFTPMTRQRAGLAGAIFVITILAVIAVAINALVAQNAQTTTERDQPDPAFLPPSQARVSDEYDLSAGGIPWLRRDRRVRCRPEGVCI